MMLQDLRNCARFWRSQRGSITPALRYLYHRFSGRHIWAHQQTRLIGAKNIVTNGLLKIGTEYYGFSHDSEPTTVRVGGRLSFLGTYSIGRGCRLDICEGAEAMFGSGYVSPNTTFVIKNRLIVGDGTAISWNCMFVDADWHDIDYQGKRNKDSSILVGNHVWIGCNVTVLAGSVIPDGCVVGAGSIVTRAFTEPNTLIAGNPARVVRTEVSWK